MPIHAALDVMTVTIQKAIDRRFEAIVFDWDGTAVPDHAADPSEVRSLVESLCAAGMDMVVVSGTHVGNVDGQLRARPTGPGRLYMCLNQGSEAFVVDASGPRPLEQRRALPEENEALDRAAAVAIERLEARGLHAEVVSRSPNRRRIDLVPPDERIDGLSEVVEIARAAAFEAGLADPCVTSDAKHVEIGLTDRSDSARWAFGRLRRSGIAASQVLIGGDEFGPLGGQQGSDSLMLVDEARKAVAVTVGREPEGVPPRVVSLGGGPPRFVELLEDQLERRTRGELPLIDAEPGWTLAFASVDPQFERVHGALMTLADGRIGTRGSPSAMHPSTDPSVLASGAYEEDERNGGLVPCPLWAMLDAWLGPTDTSARTLDLRTGTLSEELTIGEGRISTLRFSSLARPGLAVSRARGGRGSVVPAPAPSLRPGLNAEQGTADGAAWARIDTGDGGVLAAVRDATESLDGADVVDRYAAYTADPYRTPRRDGPLRAVSRASEAGFEVAFREHRERWASRWEDADVAIDGDVDLQLAVRLALYHLMGSVADTGEAAVGARGMTGPAYRGHVFWDSDVFVLPFVAATHPAAARAMLEYRVRRLPAARAMARAAGREGAQFPWESARSGNDVTPRSARDRLGNVIPIRTGQREQHIVADVAWAAAWYESWTGDTEFMTGAGAELLFDTARFWASRVRWGREGRAHIYGVIGPDEYHEPVDDNSFTNVMARWNLRAAATRAEGDPRVEAFERMRWLEVADALIDGFDPRTRLYEQFAGFFDLEPLVVADLAPRRPIAADLLLGRDRVRGAQVVKQADVLMLHHLVPDEVEPDSLVPNLDFYEPRTAHGSSLSPGIHASLFARAGRLSEAVHALELAARMDLDDLTGTTAGGVHLATMGSVWQALAFGFAGIRPKGQRLRIDPVLPEGWRTLDLTVRFRGSRVRIRVEPEAVEVRADPATAIEFPGESPVPVGAGGRRWSRTDASSGRR